MVVSLSYFLHGQMLDYGSFSFKFFNFWFSVEGFDTAVKKVWFIFYYFRGGANLCNSKTNSNLLKLDKTVELGC